MSTARRRRIAALAAIALALGGVAVTALPAYAATITVTSENDAGAGSLRQAVLDAGPGDTVSFAPTVHRIDLVTGITITKSLTISGPGQSTLTIGRANTSTFDQLTFDPAADDQDFTLSSLTIEGIVGGSGMGFFSRAVTHLPGATTITNVTVTGEHTTDGAAGLRLQSSLGDVRITGSTFTDNLGGGSQPGGAVMVIAANALIHVESSTFEGNEASGYVGGGLMFQNDQSAGPIEVVGSTFTDNHGDAGGALGAFTTAAISVESTIFDQNVTDNAGGAIYFDDVPTVAFTDSAFTDNHSLGNVGGAVFLNSNVEGLDVSGSTFTGNSSPFGGGALYYAAAGASTTIDASTFSGNSTTQADTGGGAVTIFDVADADVQITDSTFSGNEATRFGGALFVDNVGGTDGISISGSTFSDNVVDDGFVSGGNRGTGVSIFLGAVRSEFTITQSTFDEHATAGDGLYAVGIGTVDKASAGFVFGIGLSTIVGPGALYVGHGISGGTSLVDSIFSSTTTDDALYLGLDEAGYAFSMRYSLDSSPAFPGIDDQGGNQYSVADPMLAPLALNGGTTKTRLPVAGSPALDLGDPAISGAPATDQRGAGYTRIVAGRIDIGAVEVQLPVLAATGSDLPWVPAGFAALLLGLGAAAVGSRRRAIR